VRTDATAVVFRGPVLLGALAGGLSAVVFGAGVGVV
jgi:hypothetical protein